MKSWAKDKPAIRKRCIAIAEDPLPSSNCQYEILENSEMTKEEYKTGGKYSLVMIDKHSYRCKSPVEKVDETAGTQPERRFKGNKLSKAA